MDDEIVSDANDSFPAMAKSSVKLIKNSRGINWEVKVVAGEENLVDGLMQEALKVHKKMMVELEPSKLIDEEVAKNG